MRYRHLVRSIPAVALSLISVPSHAVLSTSLLGEPALAASPDRTIVVTPQTRYVRVVSGETVKFVIDGKAVTWHFDGPHGPFELSQIVPRDGLDHVVRGYVEPNPLYFP